MTLSERIGRRAGRAAYVITHLRHRRTDRVLNAYLIGYSDGVRDSEWMKR